MCQGCTFREAEWKRHAGAAWPAVECIECGALTLRKHLEPLRPDSPPMSGVRRLEVAITLKLPLVRNAG